MKRHFCMLPMLAVLFIVGCANNVKQVPEKTVAEVGKVIAKDTVKKDTIVEPEVEPLDLSQCDMVLLDNGKLCFYNSATAVMTPFVTETDSVVNCVFLPDSKVYYCVVQSPKILLRCVDLRQPDLQPQQLADWGVPYEKCVTETYGTVSPLEYYHGRNILGLNYNFSWDGYWFIDKKLYSIETGEITDWTWKWEEEYQAMQISDDEEQTDENYYYASTSDELRSCLRQEEDQYYMTDGNDGDYVCLTDRIDCASYASSPEYYQGPEFEYVSSSPDNTKVLYMIIVEWGDFAHGILAVSSVDGKFQMPLEDTDCTGYTAQWLEDGSLVYVGEAPLPPDDPDNDASWHYRTHCIKRIYPDGHTEIIASCGDFVTKKSVVH